MTDTPKPLLNHIIELREVLIRSLFAILIVMIVSFIFIDSIFGFILKPLLKIISEQGLDTKVIYTSITEIFSTQLRLSFYTSLSISFPYIIFQFWKFIRPALKIEEVSTSRFFILLSILLFALGGFFAFQIVVPKLFLTLTNYSKNISISFLPKISENISFITTLIFSFGVSFQMPILIYALDRFKIIEIRIIAKLWREVILAIVVISAIITPPDALSMAFLAIPLLLLYFISIAFCYCLRK